MEEIDNDSKLDDICEIKIQFYLILDLRYK